MPPPEDTEVEIYIIGGSYFGDQFSNDVWSWALSNGEWTAKLVDGNVRFGARVYIAAATHKGNIYITGGAVPYSAANSEDFAINRDVWYSANGANWNQRNRAKNTLFDAGKYTTEHMMVSDGEKIYVMGGGNIGRERNDVWVSSNNGQDWSRRNNAQWQPRLRGAATFFNGQIYVSGGDSDSAGSFGDVWRLTDAGNNWERLNGNAYPARHGHAMVVMGGKMYTIGGSRDNSYTDVWASSDGQTWEQKTDRISYTIPGKSNPAYLNSFYSAVATSNRIYVIGVGDVLDDEGGVQVWSSSDGEVWRRDATTKTIPKYLRWPAVVLSP